MNSVYLQLPIKTFNRAIKINIVRDDQDFDYLDKGILYKKNYFNFKATKVIQNYELCSSDEDVDDIILHINQIKLNEDLIIAIVFLDRIEVRELVKTNFQKFNLVSQHNNSCYQIHCDVETIRSYSECLTII